MMAILWNIQSKRQLKSVQLIILNMVMYIINFLPELYENCWVYAMGMGTSTIMEKNSLKQFGLKQEKSGMIHNHIYVLIGKICFCN